MDELRVNDDLVIPSGELRLSFTRSSGPGGQNVNKVSSKVELRWTPAESAALAGYADREWLLSRLASRLTQSGDLLVTSSRTRDQGRNRDDARAKLVEIIRRALTRPKKRKHTRPSAGAKKRRLEDKKRRADIKRRRGEQE